MSCPTISVANCKTCTYIVDNFWLTYVLNRSQHNTVLIWFDSKMMVPCRPKHVGIFIVILKKVTWSRYRPCVTQRVGRGIALLFHDRGTRRGWMVSSTPRPHFTPGKDPVPILQEAGWAPGLVWTGGKSRPHRDSIPDRPARSQSLHRLSYLAHHCDTIIQISKGQVCAFCWFSVMNLFCQFSLLEAMRQVL